MRPHPVLGDPLGTAGAVGGRRWTHAERHRLVPRRPHPSRTSARCKRPRRTGRRHRRRAGGGGAHRRRRPRAGCRRRLAERRLPGGARPRGHALDPVAHLRLPGHAPRLLLRRGGQRRLARRGRALRPLARIPHRAAGGTDALVRGPRRRGARRRRRPRTRPEHGRGGRPPRWRSSVASADRHGSVPEPARCPGGRRAGSRSGTSSTGWRGRAGSGGRAVPTRGCGRGARWPCPAGGRPRRCPGGHRGR